MTLFAKTGFFKGWTNATKCCDPKFGGDSCDLTPLQVAWNKCTVEYGLAADGSGMLDIPNIHFLWESTTDGINYVTIGEGDGLVRVDIVGTPSFVRLTVNCSGSVVTYLMDNQQAYTSQPWAFNTFIHYSINGGPSLYLVETALWFSYLDILELQNLNPLEVASSYNSVYGPVYPGPDLLMDINTVPNQVLYKDMGAIALVDAVFPQPGCGFQFNYDINFVPQPAVSASNTVICNTPVTLTANYGSNVTELYTTYQWKKNGVTIGGATSKTYDATTAGLYTCTCTHHGITVTSANFNLPLSPNIPQPIITVDVTGHEYYLNTATGDYYFQSNDQGVLMTIVDLGIFSGGYPAGTNFDFYGAGAILYQSGTDNTFFNANNSDAFYVVVTLPALMGACSGTSNPHLIDFGTAQQPQQANYADYQVLTCIGGVGGVGGVPDYFNPPDAQCGWSVTNDRCFDLGTFAWQRDLIVQYGVACVIIKDDEPIFNIVDNGNGTWTITTTGIGALNGNDYTPGAVWTSLIGGGNITVNTPLSITVNAPGIYTFWGGQGVATNNGISGQDIIQFANFNIFIN